MFTEAYHQEITGYFEQQMDLLRKRKEQLQRGQQEASGEEAWPGLEIALLEQKMKEIRGTLEACGEDEAEGLRFLYSAMPLSDMLDYPAYLFRAYARHSAFLWKEGPFAGRVPEKIFANYVLHHRINNEDLTDTRAFFYEKLKDRVAGMNMAEAAMEINLWCAEEATYRVTDGRSQNPVTMYYTGVGRCGEESTFTITVLRSLGIPARQVYVPLWSHCDDNHAWVEAWCDGRWRILGACEPEETLDDGWFIGPATRAMQVQSVWFGKDRPLDSIVGRRGMSAVVNHLDLYAPTGILKVRVEDEKGVPVPEARVEFQILNYSEFGNVATLTTSAAGEEPGTVTLITGYGSLLVSASRDGLYGETLVTLAETPIREAGGTSAEMPAGEAGETSAETPIREAGGTSAETPIREADGTSAEMPAGKTAGNLTEATVVLRKEMPALNQWRNVDFHAPREAVRNQQLSKEQMKARELRGKRQAECRQAKMDRFYCSREGERVLGRFAGEDRAEVENILKASYGNQKEIVRFLDWDFRGLMSCLADREGGDHWRLRALRTLKEKDYWDMKAEVLVDACICAAPYADRYPEDIFDSYLLCPRVAHEMLQPHRAALRRCIPIQDQEAIRRNPKALPCELTRWLAALPSQEYGSLITSPMGCLTGGIANELSQLILCVKIYRTLGIPARLRFMDRALEYYQDGFFHMCERMERETKEEGTVRLVPAGNGTETTDNTKRGRLILQGEKGFDFRDWARYSISRYEKGHFRFLFLEEDEEQVKERLEVELEPGIYRAVTTTRLPNGDQFARVCDFDLAEGEEKHLCLEQRTFSVQALFRNMPVKDFVFETPEGRERTLSQLAAAGRTLFLWLEPGREPTEHILNELVEKKELLKNLEKRVCLIAPRIQDYAENEGIRRAAASCPGLCLLAGNTGEEYRSLAMSMGQNSGIFPLAFVMQSPGQCIYAEEGYNVGMAELLLKMLSEE